ncbi:hypothetical protein BJY52DRAFT_28669 [Lactarius psammicola]|nr:hypothetical protein BJY52DRAFT_28669 [Lactarius psammicola]
MAYQRHPSDVYMRQNRASTAPGPMQPSFPRDAAIPPSLIPGYRHRQTISVTSSVDGLLFSQADTGTRSETGKVSATPGGGIPEYYYMSPSPYHDLPAQTQPPPPLLPPQQNPALPPLPPKAPIISPSMSPMLPPKPPPFMPSLPPYNHKPPPRSKSQPPPPLPRGASPPFNAPPRQPPPMLPPKPHAARSTSVIVTPSHLPFPVTPREKASPDTDEASLILPSLSSPVDSPLEPPVVNEDEELELALKLSAHEERDYTESLLSQDEELARALEESLLYLARPLHPKPSTRATVTESDRLPTSSSTRPLETHPYSPKQHPHFPLPVRADSSTSLASLAHVQLKEDEAYARKLEAEYESGRSTPTTLSNHNVDLKLTEDRQLPRYADIVKDTATPYLESDATGRVPRLSPTPTRTDKRHSAPRQTSTVVPPQQTPPSSQRTSPRPASLALSLSPSEEEDSGESPPASPRASRAFVTPNQFIEPQLLYGVSFGFHMPPMDVFIMRDPLPNIISLPYGKCPPMHVQAPSWRQLLKLMAKLSATQIEPSTEAIAATKGELKLRTVVQFFKVHRSSPDWRTVIYLTIDYPPPPDPRFTNGDVNVLPYSYNLSALPTLLSDGPESHVSKYYTIPATSRTPLPKLPITMPSMAMYLASALDDSRRALSDTSSGVRRLAKMVDQFYPNESTPAGGEEEVRRRGGRALIGRLMGRTSKPPRGRNADVYDLVTPFVPDEWG